MKSFLSVLVLSALFFFNISLVHACTGGVFLGPLGPDMESIDGSQAVVMKHNNGADSYAVRYFPEGSEDQGADFDFVYEHNSYAIFKGGPMGGMNDKGNGLHGINRACSSNCIRVDGARERGYALADNFEELYDLMKIESWRHGVYMGGYDQNGQIKVAEMEEEQLTVLTPQNPLIIKSNEADRAWDLARDTSNWFHGDPNRLEVRDMAYIWHRFNTGAHWTTFQVPKYKIYWCTVSKPSRSPLIPFVFDDPYVHPTYEDYSYYNAANYALTEIDQIEDLIMDIDGNVKGSAREIQNCIAEGVNMDFSEVESCLISATDSDGTSTPECDDGLDNDNDGYCDTSGATCSDGSTPGDIGCSDANDRDETNCGDSQCEGGETYLTCSQDCQLAQTCIQAGGDCCTGSETCPGSDLSTFPDCSGICCSESCDSPPTCQNQGYYCCGSSSCQGTVYNLYCPDSLSCCDSCESSGDLVLWLPFNGDISDASGNAHIVTNYGATLVEDMDGNTNSAYTFNGDDYIEVNDDPILDGMSELSVCLWVNITSKSDWAFMLSKNTDNFVTSSYGFGLDDSDNQLFDFTISTDSDTATVRTDNPPNTNQWYHICGIYDGSEVSIWENGIKQAETDPHSGSITETTLPVRIGSAETAYFDGIMDDIRIYNTALSQEEIQTLYEGQQTYHRADTNTNCVIETTELFAFMNRWKVSIADVGMVEMMEAIELWKLGNACS